MPRRIRSVAYQDTSGNSQPADNYVDRVVKYVPTDVVGAWIAITTLIRGATNIPKAWLLWGFFLAGLVFTFFWTTRQTTLPEKPPAIVQSIMATVAFLVWVFALGEPFTSFDFYRPVYGSLALIVFSLGSGLIIAKESKS